MVRKITLCSENGCCPAVEIQDDKVLIGEEGNLCVLKPNEWAELRARVLSGEL